MPAFLQNLSVQDLFAIFAGVAAAVWLVRTLLSRLLAPPCGPPPGVPPGHDGFVPLDGLKGPAGGCGLPSPPSYLTPPEAPSQPR